QRLVVGERRQHQARQVRQLRPEVAADADPVAVRQPDVEHGDLRPDRRDPRESLGRGRRLTHHLDVAFGLEEVAHAAAYDLVVIEQEYADHPAIVLARGSVRAGTKVPTSWGLWTVDAGPSALPTVRRGGRRWMQRGRPAPLEGRSS